MPQTVPDGFPYESPPNPEVNAEPGITLHGGSAGGEDILAEVVQSKVSTIDDTIADIQAELGRGWKDIVRGDAVSQGQNIAIESETYDMIRVTLRGSLNDGEGGPGLGWVNIRINNDTTSGLHKGQVLGLAPDGSVEDFDNTAGAVWHLALWGSSTNNVAHALLLNTHESARVSFDGGGARMANTPGNRTRSISSGDLDSNRLLTSIRFGASGGAEIDSATLWIEGHVAA